MVQEHAIETEHPDLSMVNDLTPNAAWEYAHQRRHGQGILSRGMWLAAFPDDGSPEFTNDTGRALTFDTRSNALPIATRLLRHYIATGVHEQVTVISLNAGGRR